MLTPWVRRLLFANVLVFIAVWIARIAGWDPRPYLWLLPSDVLTQPWTLLTYMFMHGGVLHLLFNMIGLFFFGPVLEERWGSREFLKFYLIAGLGGALLSFLFPGAPIVGASGAIYGLLLAYAYYWPDNQIYIYGILPVKAKWLVGGLITLGLVQAVFGGGTGIAHLAHLGGAGAAFLYLKSPWGPDTRPNWGAVSSPSRSMVGVGKPTAVQKREAELREVRRNERAEQRRTLDEVDRILDKISAEGLGSLTPDERRQLDEASRRFRTN